MVTADQKIKLQNQCVEMISSNPLSGIRLQIVNLHSLKIGKKLICGRYITFGTDAVIRH